MCNLSVKLSPTDAVQISSILAANVAFSKQFVSLFFFQIQHKEKRSLCESQNTVVNDYKVPRDEARPSYRSTTSYYTDSNVLAFVMRILNWFETKSTISIQEVRNTNHSAPQVGLHSTK